MKKEPMKRGRGRPRAAEPVVSMYEHSVWLNMLSRCRNPNANGYAYYGGRGIKVCARWLVFRAFLEDMGRTTKGMSIERKDNDRGYEPGNCKWASRVDQLNNTRANRMIQVGGEWLTCAQYARSVGLPYKLVYGRLCRGGNTLPRRGEVNG